MTDKLRLFKGCSWLTKMYLNIDGFFVLIYKRAIHCLSVDDEWFVDTVSVFARWSI